LNTAAGIILRRTGGHYFEGPNMRRALAGQKKYGVRRGHRGVDAACGMISGGFVMAESPRD
jgi:hypothetical protein